MSTGKVQLTYEVAEKLKALGCYRGLVIDEYTEFWITSWGFGFTVPKVAGRCPTVIWLDIIAQIEKTRPT